MTEFDLFLMTVCILSVVAAYVIANRWQRLRRMDSQ